MAQRPCGRGTLHTHRWEQVSVAKSPWGKDGDTPPPRLQKSTQNTGRRTAL